MSSTAANGKTGTAQGLWSIAIFFALVLAVLVTVHWAGDAHFDFGVFYYAANMVYDGARTSLYNVAAQHAFQARFNRPVSQLFYYPPYALVPFLALAWLPPMGAFAVWTVAQLSILYASIRKLGSLACIDYGQWPILLALAFMPVSTDLAHGQVSLVVLAGYLLAYLLWVRKQRFLGGLALSLAAIKFQLVFGFAAVLLLRRKGQELAGLITGGSALFLVSLLITGWPALRAYPNFVMHSEGGIGSEPANMANLRGLLSLFGADHLVVLIALSVAVVAMAAWAWCDLDRGFSAALLATMLTSYHFNPQDLTICLLPFFLCVKNGTIARARVPHAALVMVMIPMVVAGMGAPYAVLALVLIAGLIWLLALRQRMDQSTGAPAQSVA